MRRYSIGLLPSQGLAKGVLAVSLAALLAACSGSGYDPEARSRHPYRGTFTEEEYGVSTSPRVADGNSRVRKGGGIYKTGVPYKVAGRWYVPREEPGYDRSGVGSWYGDDFHGRKTANGEIFDMRALTAAHPTLPMPSYAYVTNLQNNRTILVRINDRGPYVRDRVIDLSHASARALGYEGQGRAHVRVRYAGRAPLNGDDRRERQYLASQPWSRGGGALVADAGPSRPAPEPEVPYMQRGASEAWSPAEYRARLANKPVPRGFADASRPHYQTTASIESEQIRPVANGGANMPEQRAPSGLVWQSSPRAKEMPRAPASDWSARSALGNTTNANAANSGPAYVQVGMFRDLKHAESLRGDLGALGPVEVAGVDEGSGMFYRVRIGPFPYAQANAALGEVSRHGIKGAKVVFD